MGRENVEKLVDNISKRLIGKRDIIDKVIIVLLAGGHVLLEDVPGVGKTTLAKALADSLECSFSRIQCTPDTMPSDITGVSIYNAKKSEFEVNLGPIVNQIVLADEINRTSPKTQAALLEAMEERQVTIDGNTIPIPEPFMVIGTQNPKEMTGVYPLPEAQLDRFMMKLSLGYPSTEGAVEISKSFLSGAMAGPIERVLTPAQIRQMKDELGMVKIHDDLIDYCVKLVEATRKNTNINCGASTRALLDLMRASQARAYIDGRDYCIPLDIIEMAKCVLPHRLILSSEAKMNRLSNETVLIQILNSIPTPR